MKKPKKHNFKYRDPLSQENRETPKESGVQEEQKEGTQIAAEKDFKRVVLVTSIFVIIILIFYFLQSKINFDTFLQKIIKF